LRCGISQKPAPFLPLHVLPRPANATRPESFLRTVSRYHRKCFPKNPTPPPTVTNPPHNITDPPIYVTDFPIYITNPPINITRTKPHSRIASRAKPGNLTSFWLSGFPRASQCTNTPNSTQNIRQQNQSLTGDFLDKIALIASIQNCSTWNNLLFHAKTAQTARL